MATLQENIKQAITDFDNIKATLEKFGVEIPYGTDTKEYPRKIEEAVANAADYAVEDINSVLATLVTVE